MERRKSSRLQRKRGESDEGSTAMTGAPAPKRSRAATSGAVSADSGATLPAVKWEWLSDSGWMAFDSKTSIAIDKAFREEKEDLEVKIPGAKQKFKVHFGTMAQANMVTGWKRDIRCTSDSGSAASSDVGAGSTSSKSGEWEWKDEHAQWNGYAAEVCRLLDACRLRGVDGWQIEACSRKYRVELVGKEEGWSQVNIETSVKRYVRCGEVRQVASAAGAMTASNDQASDDDQAEATKASTTKGKSKKGKSKLKKEDSEAGSNGSNKKEKGKSKGAEKEEGSDSHVLVTYKGKVPVDRECDQKIGKAHVLSEGGDHWDATLNQTNVNNNNNKYYILQLLQDNDVNKYSVWFRWGRVGKSGQSSLINCGSNLEEAKRTFTKKFSDKTCNAWDNRSIFVKHDGKYDLLAMDYEAKEEASVDEEDSKVKSDSGDAKPAPVESTLDKRLQSLIELVCDVQAMEDTVVEMKYDTQKAPLGKLTAEQVKSGYAALKKIEACIDNGDVGNRLVTACNEFYTRIPHCFGMKRPPLIRTKQDVKEKIALLETLSDIQIALKVLHEGDKKEHPIDRHYHSLHCGLVAVEEESEVFRQIEKYVLQTHASTHSQYTLEVQQVFLVDREGEARAFKDVGNRKLLWHGSRLSNWVGILSQGLRIAPPEAPITGYMFGKGIYFADMCSKSANYCFTTRSKNEGLAMLCDVSLGTPQELLAANYSADQLPKGKHSTKGLGSVAPDPAQNQTLDGSTVPLGTTINTGVKNPSGYTLNYNEYIVYDTAQVKMKYLVRLKFHYK